MPSHDLRSDDGLRDACHEVQLQLDSDPEALAWKDHLARFLEWVQRANEHERSTPEFQRRLWDSEDVSAAGQGNIPVDAALGAQAFREWLVRRTMERLPDQSDDRARHLTQLYEEMLERLLPYCGRKPHLKILRVIAALYPGALTSIADRRILRAVHKAMGGPRAAGFVGRHVWMLDRLDQVLGPPASGFPGIAERISLPWHLYARIVQPTDEDTTEAVSSTPGAERLIPLPAARRRRGMTALRGLLPAVLAALEFVREGVMREELIDYLRSQAPDVKESFLGVTINVLQGDLGVLRRDGDRYVLTERGESVLESQDPSELADWLLTRVLGVDGALVELRQREGAIKTSELIRTIQSFNPNWRTTFVPSAILAWLRSFGVIQARADGTTVLTETGHEWAARIHWTPERLPPDDEVLSDVASAPEQAAAVETSRMVLPPFQDIYRQISRAGQFDESQVAWLHAGIWAHRRRHFAILTGLSGSGKTLLAREYAKALVPEGASISRHVCTIAVQPGWYDPGALLGYVNPMRGDAYVSTPFLEFLLGASQDPERPYIAVLDEMNLSHPEQYLAPVLSAMETGARIDFHTEGDILDGIPPSIAYPANLVLIGTVNMDETTHGLSDKVLDRAFTMEFWNIDLERYPRWSQRSLPAPHEQRARTALKDLMDALAPARLHFGWRVVDDVLDFLAMVLAATPQDGLDDALDAAVYAKIVPKLRGDDSSRFRTALDQCQAALLRHGLEHSHTKVVELRADLEATGTARFWR